MKKIGIVGSRSRDTIKDYMKCLKIFLKIYKKGDRIVSGGCPKGGDRFAEVIAKSHDIPISIYPAKWHKYGRSAGFIRNTDIARDSDELIAVVAKNRKGGTEDTIKKFEKKSDKKATLVK